MDETRLKTQLASIIGVLVLEYYVVVQVRTVL